MNSRYANRAAAGRLLAKWLAPHARDVDALVLALPRGGVPVAYEIARALKLPLDVMVVRKVGLPGHEEYALGAIASGGVRVWNEEALAQVEISPRRLEALAAAEEREVARREAVFRGRRAPPVVKGRKIILVDDGLATGATMRVAIAALRERRPAAITVAVPVAAPEIARLIRDEVDELICPFLPEAMGAVGAWYEDFSQTTDAEVCDLLERARAWGDGR